MNTKILSRLGSRIKELRKQQGLTQEVLAEKFNNLKILLIVSIDNNFYSCLNVVTAVLKNC